MEWNGMAFCMDASRCIEIIHTHFVGRQHGVYLGSPIGLEMDSNGKSPLVLIVFWIEEERGRENEK